MSWPFRGYPIEVELNLGEYHFPELSDDVSTDYRRAFAQLYGELIDARPVPSKVKITSKLEQNVQVLLIEHNGIPVDESVLRKLNSELEACARGQANYKGRPHGNHIAANILCKHGGRVRILNIVSGEYKVQTYVEIPLTNPNTLPNS